MRRISRRARRDAAREAASAFASRPTAAVVLPRQEEKKPPPPTPAVNTVPAWRESQEILKRLLAEGKIKTSR